MTTVTAVIPRMNRFDKETTENITIESIIRQTSVGNNRQIELIRKATKNLFASDLSSITSWTSSGVHGFLENDW